MNEKIFKLLEAEARERVEMVPLEGHLVDQGFKFLVDDLAWACLWADGEVTRCGIAECLRDSIGQALCFTAALAEKRRREGEVSDGV